MTMSPWRSMALEVVERFAAAAAPVERLAGRGAVRAGQLHVGGSAAGAFQAGRHGLQRTGAAAEPRDVDDLLRRAADRRRDAVLAQALAPGIAEPVRGPGGGQAGRDADAIDAARGQALDDHLG